MRTALALGRIGAADAVPALIQALHDEEGSVRSVAAHILPAIDLTSATPAIPTLIQALHDEDGFVRSVAAHTLGKIGPGAATAVPALIQALHDEDGFVHSVAAHTLGKIGPGAATAVPALIQALHDKDGFVLRSAAALALGKIGPGAATAVPALIQALHDEDGSVRSAAALALGEIGPGSAVPALIQALHDEDSSVRSAAALALGKIGPGAATALPALVQALHDEDGFVRVGTAFALSWIGPAAREAAPSLIIGRRLLEASDDKFLVLLRQITNDPTWKTQDPELWAFGPHFWASLIWDDFLSQLQELPFIRRMLYAELCRKGHSVDNFDDASQELYLQLMGETTRQLVYQPEKYPTLPKIVANLVKAAVRGIGKGTANSRGGGPMILLSKEDFAEQRFVAEASVIGLTEVKELAIRFHEHLFKRMTGLRQVLMIQSLLKGVSIENLGDVVGKKKGGIIRHFNNARDELLTVTQLQDLTELKQLAQYVVFGLLDGVVPDVVAERQEQ